MNKQCTKCGRLKSKTNKHICPTSTWNKGLKGLQIGWNKGKKSKDSTKKKISNTRKKLIKEGKIPSTKGKNNGMFGKTPWNKGKKMDFISPKKGIKISKEIRLKTSGANHYNWKGGKGSINNRIRKCYEYRQWTQDIFKRDDYVCQECDIRGGKLEAHHIKPFSVLIKEYKIKTLQEAIDCFELWDFDNGQTLCKKCHKKTSTYLKNNI